MGKNISPAVCDYPDIKKVRTGPTRRNKTLDIIFTNVTKITEALTLEPLETEEGLSLIHI